MSPGALGLAQIPLPQRILFDASAIAYAWNKMPCVMSVADRGGGAPRELCVIFTPVGVRRAHGSGGDRELRGPYDVAVLEIEEQAIAGCRWCFGMELDGRAWAAGVFGVHVQVGEVGRS